MATTQIQGLKEHIKILANFQASLVNTWESDQTRPWTVYSKEQFRRFWDIHTVEHRLK